MKKLGLFQLLQGLQAVAEYPGAKFAYGVAKNISLITPECDLIKKLSAPSAELQEYEQERVNLAEKFADKNEDGTPEIRDNNYVMSDENRDQFVAEVKALQERYSDAIAAQNAKAQDVNALLEEESDIELYKISEALLPEEITASQVFSIFAVIE